MSARVSAVVMLLWVASLAAPQAQQPTPLTSPLVTPVPTVMWLSGVFRPMTPQPIAAVESVTVTIYRERDSGDALWQETQGIAMEPGGRYNLLIGSTSADGLPLELFTSGEARWIGITFNRPGEVEQPRVPMASVPYALKAADADTLGGWPASAYLRAGAASRAIASGSTDGVSLPASGQAAAADVTVMTAGTPGYLGLFTDSANLGNSVLFQSGNAIALGATVPRDMFHVSFTDGNGALTGYGVQNLSGAAGAYSGMLFYDQNNVLGLFQGFNNASHEYRINNVASGGSINFRIGGSSRFLVANNGNIGIGVPAPVFKLDVAGVINSSAQYNINGTRMLGASSDLSSVFVGPGSGLFSQATLNNSFVGGGSGSNTIGSHNTLIGYQAGLANTGGCCNTMLGAFTGLVFVPGSGNTLLGYGANLGAIGLSNATAIGALATVSASNSLVLGSIAGVNGAVADTRVGIGIVDPARKLHLSGVGSDGSGVADLRITGTGQIGSGVTLESIGTGGRAYSLLSTAEDAYVGGAGGGRLGVYDVSAAQFRMVIDESGNVGIGTFTPDHMLSVNGDANKAVGGGSWDFFSDERLKNIKGPFTPGLTAVMELQPIRYEYKPDNALGLRSSREHIGFSAQAVQKIIPDAVSTNDKGYLLVNNDPILWTMLNAIQEQQREIQDLHRRLAALEAVVSGRR